MDLRRKDRKKPARRPKKTESEKRRRLLTQKRRLTKLGAPEAEVKKMTRDQVRQKLRRPVRTAALYAKK